MLASLDSKLLDVVTGGASPEAAPFEQADAVAQADLVKTGALATYCGSLDKAATQMTGEAARLVRLEARNCWRGLRKSFTE